MRIELAKVGVEHTCRCTKSMPSAGKTDARLAAVFQVTPQCQPEMLNPVARTETIHKHAGTEHLTTMCMSGLFHDSRKYRAPSHAD
jgi:hypothetical protein